MRVFVTGIAGFIGFHVANALSSRGDTVVGLDNFNDYYDPRLKRDRVAALAGELEVIEGDLKDLTTVTQAITKAKPDAVIHLGAQAGVRYSLENPHAYADSNLSGHLNILEVCRHSETVQHLVYASSSSVYGGLKKELFSESDPVDYPVSLYAATKRADELMSHTYAHLYGLAQTGLRFFTVYGPWGRPDMAPWLFTEAILRDQPIKVFNHGKMERDFTYIDDIVDGIIRALDNKPSRGTSGDPATDAPHRLYNIGNNRPQPLMTFIEIIEAATGRTAEKIFMDMQPGDVPRTAADISRIESDLGYRPTVPLQEGLPKFVDWYRAYKSV